MKNSYILIIFISLNIASCSRNTGDSYIRISKANPRYFEYNTGVPYIPVGPNICWNRFETNEEKVLEWYDKLFKTLSENGGNYTRIWLSAPFFEIEHTRAYEYDENIAQRIDRLLTSADKYGIKIKFCFENFRKLTGQPAPFSTSVPFDKPIYSVENGGPIQSIDDYFSTAEGKKLFLSKARFYAQRYAGHPAIFGWELWNEINSVSVSDKQIIYDWTSEMLPAIQSLFPNHLVMQSLGSYDTESAREIYTDYMTIPSNKVAQVHRYLDSGATWDICHASMDTLANNAVNELLNMTHTKPVVLSEVGAVEARHAGPFRYYERDTLGILLHDLLFTPFFSGAAGAGQSWHWQYYIEKNTLWWHFRRFCNAIKDINPVKENYQPFFIRKDDVRYYGLKGNTHTLIWCRDTKSNWETELINNLIPEQRETKISLSQLSTREDTSVRQYNPWDDTWLDIIPKNGVITLNFTRSAVIRINCLN